MSNEKVAPKTGADTSVLFTIRGDDHACLSASGLAGVEEITIEVKQGSNWAPLLTGSSAVKLTVTNTFEKISGVGEYRANKPITVGAVGIYLNESHYL